MVQRAINLRWQGRQKHCKKEVRCVGHRHMEKHKGGATLAVVGSLQSNRNWRGLTCKDFVGPNQHVLWQTVSETRSESGSSSPRTLRLMYLEGKHVRKHLLSPHLYLMAHGRSLCCMVASGSLAPAATWAVKRKRSFLHKQEEKQGQSHQIHD